MTAQDVSGDGNPWKKEEDVFVPAILLLTGFMAAARFRLSLLLQST